MRLLARTDERAKLVAQIAGQLMAGWGFHGKASDHPPHLAEQFQRNLDDNIESSVAIAQKIVALVAPDDR